MPDFNKIFVEVKIGVVLDNIFSHKWNEWFLLLILGYSFESSDYIAKCANGANVNSYVFHLTIALFTIHYNIFIIIPRVH